MLRDLLKRLHQVRIEIRQTWEATEQILRTQYAINKEQSREMPAATEGPPPTWVPPGHYYSPIVDPAELERRRSRIFDRTQRPSGIDLHEQEQISLFRALKPHYDRLPFAPGPTPGLRYHYDNPSYSYADAIILACLLMHLRPRRLVEFGSGYSSCVTLDVNETFLDGTMDCVFVDPYPELLYSLLKPDDAKQVRIIPSAAQDVDLALIDALEAGDVLFIDSTHVSKAGSDVNFHIFTVLPRLKSGVYVHFHDIFFPFEYPEDWFFRENHSWNELYLLRAFLVGNEDFKIVFFHDFLFRQHRAEIEKEMPLFIRNSGGSLWLKKR